MASNDFRSVLKVVTKQEPDTWDYQWMYAIWKHGGLSCMPRVNLISNIGFGPGATHTKSPESRLANLSTSPLLLPLVHPHEVRRAATADDWTETSLFKIDGASGLLRRSTAALRGRLREPYHSARAARRAGR